MRSPASGPSPSIRRRRIAASARKLMDAVLDRARERNFAGVRLVQAAFHNRSLSLYTKLGFDVREPLAVMQGPAIKKTYEGYHGAQGARPSDLEACNRVALRVHGHHRGGELADAIRQGTATVVERNGRITGYASSLAFYGHAVAETNPDLQAHHRGGRQLRRARDPGAIAQRGAVSAGAWRTACAWWSP